MNKHTPTILLINLLIIMPGLLISCSDTASDTKSQDQQNNSQPVLQTIKEPTSQPVKETMPQPVKETVKEVIKEQKLQNQNLKKIFDNCVLKDNHIECIDLDYANTNNIRQTLNLWIPCKNKKVLEDCMSDESYELIVHVHGGGFVAGQKRESPNISLLNTGFAYASINYRLGVAGLFPNFLHDQKAAIRWLRANEKKYNLTTENIGAYGNSAGGASVGLLAATSGLQNYTINERSINLEGNVGGNLEYSSNIQAAANFSGHSDAIKLTQQPTGAKPRVVVPNLLSAISLITYLGEGIPMPHLIIHGDKDQVVYYEQALIYLNKLQEIYPNQTVEYNLITIENGGHGGWGSSVGQETNNILKNFFLRHIKKFTNIPEEKSRTLVSNTTN
ncbi:MAG: hypothetical protein CL872_04095 [Dehalococcoidaceae bacterium]|nr:hypothetical protein [Dehalococcoidaceae bacterium]